MEEENDTNVSIQFFIRPCTCLRWVLYFRYANEYVFITLMMKTKWYVVVVIKALKHG